MEAAAKAKLSNLIQFVTLAYVDDDINEQYRDWKKQIKKCPSARRRGTGQKMKKSTLI